MWVDLELRLVADVGIIGVPNAGEGLQLWPHRLLFTSLPYVRGHWPL